MTDCREQIDNLLGELVCISDQAFREDEQAYMEFTKVYRLTFDIMKDFFESIEMLNSAGLNLDYHILHQQIKNLLDIEKEKNLLFLGDTLRYEIVPALELYRDIQQQIVASENKE